MSYDYEKNRDYDFPYAMWCGDIDPNDVAEVIHSRPGENDEANWLYVVKLNDGRLAYVTSWCDYTGWGCQEGGWSAIADSIEALLPEMDAEGRQAFGYEPMPDCRI